MKQLAWANIIWDRRAMMNKALKSFKDAGKYDAAICEWEACPIASQTWDNLKVLMCMYSKTNCQDSVSARATGHVSVNNVMEDYAAATEELIENLTEHHSKQLEALIAANNNNMAKLLAVLGKMALAATAAAASLATSKAEQAAARCKAWLQKCKNAKECKNCNKFHPACTDNQCWELESNAAKHPANWTSSKSARRCAGLLVNTETLAKSKVTSNCSYFAFVNYWAPLNENNDEDELTLAIAVSPAHHTQLEEEFQHNFQQWLHQRCGVKIQHQHRTS